MNENIILFVSNCYGEDRSAAIIAFELKKILNNNFNILAATLIGNGDEYRKRNIELLYSSFLPPSGGFPTKSIIGFLKDFFSGSFISLLDFLKKLKSVKNNIKLCVIVGDVFLLWLVRRVLKFQKIIFIFLPKSYYIEPYYKIEKKYIIKNSSVFFTRDQYTCDMLNKSGYQAFFFGNPIMDDLIPTNFNFNLNNKLKTIGILPGSRQEAYKNLILILKLIENLEKKQNFNYLLSLSENIDLLLIERKLKNLGWFLKYNFIIEKGLIKVYYYKNKFVDIILNSDIIIGLAGTANEQAVGLGKPVITFRGTGPQTTKTRFIEQEKLLGGASKFINNYPNGVIEEILNLANNPNEIKKRIEIGKLHMGEPGGSKLIAEFIYKNFIL